MIVQTDIIAKERRQNLSQHARPWSSWGGEVDKMRCDSTHSHLFRETLSRLPSSTSSVDTRVDELRSKGKGRRCPSCGECAEDCSCRRDILSLEAKVKELKKSAKKKKQDDDSGWKEMEQRLEKLAISVENLQIAGRTGQGPAPASHSALTSSAAPASTP